MRRIIARFPFDRSEGEGEQSMKGIKPEPRAGASVTLGRRTYPVKQVGAVITRQDRRDFTAGEMTTALTRLGFTCHAAPERLPAAPPCPPETAASLFGTPALTAPPSSITQTPPHPAM
jgi:hypothetical protein